MAFRVVVIFVVLLAADAYFWQGRYTRTAMQTGRGLARDFNYQIARLLEPLHH